MTPRERETEKLRDLKASSRALTRLVVQIEDAGRRDKGAAERTLKALVPEYRNDVYAACMRVTGGNGSKANKVGTPTSRRKRGKKSA